MEFVPNGTLEAFLKRKRKAWCMQPPETRRGKEAVSAVRLLTFAFQVANGMEYIASKHVSVKLSFKPFKPNQIKSNQIKSNQINQHLVPYKHNI